MTRPLIAMLLLLLTGCSRDSQTQNPANASQPSFEVPKSFAELAKYQYKSEMNLRFPDLIVYDRYSFYKKYGEEILRTFQMKDSISTDRIGLALYTYSIGPVKYNGVRWLRNVDGEWRISLSQYFSSYSDDPFEDGAPEKAKEIIKKADNWKKSNKGVWWEW